MSYEVVRLYYGSIDGFLGESTPVHGYAIKHPQGLVLVDTGWGGPNLASMPWKYVVRTVAEALDDHGLSPADVKWLVNTHLSTDHCGQNAIFKNIPIVVQRDEIEHMRKNDPDTTGWYDWAGAKFEVLEGDAEILPGVTAISTPGHTPGHQSVLVEDTDQSELLVGDAAYLWEIWDKPEELTEEHRAWPGQFRATGDPDLWRRSVDRLRSMDVDTVHLCHDVEVRRTHSH
jgi:glyoxylase-like metal-dependent hydrolase (beta-lactamase superfamily II)